MKNKMNSILSISTLLWVASQSIVPTSQAGIFIGAVSGNAFQGAKIGAAVGGGVGLIIGAGEIMSSGTDDAGFILGYLTFSGAVVGTLLDVDASLSEAALVQSFAEHFSFIDNREVFQTLADETKRRLVLALRSPPGLESAWIQFSASEVISMFSNVDLTEEQLQYLIQELG